MSHRVFAQDQTLEHRLVDDAAFYQLILYCHIGALAEVPPLPLCFCHLLECCVYQRPLLVGSIERLQ
jgi:hypothetical protein